MNTSFSFQMSFLVRSGFNVKYVKQDKWMPVLSRNLDITHSSIRKASKREKKQNNITKAISPVKIKGEDISQKLEVNQCEPCHVVNVGDGSAKENDGGVGKVSHAPEETARKPYPKISNFLIRNIMTFPILGPSCDAEEDYQTEDSKISSFPSVSTILNETMSAESRKALEKWKQNMTAQLGSEKFLEMNKATLSRGSRLHKAIKSYLLGKEMTDIEVDETFEGCWRSVLTALPHISNVKLVESWVYHPHLHYKGIVDCVACFNNVPHVIEWKQSEKTKKNLRDTFDAPIQLCAYMGTMPWCKSVNFSEPITSGLVVIAYVDGSPADIFSLNSECCQCYWEQWLRRVQQFWLSHSSEPKDNLSQEECNIGNYE